ncbi:subclass B1 metallo-beta-lactamase [Inquilinus sp. KBS0705]|nr:subclass B1 metallo-beta-lactamase [Inquilinus sp. KBS0705]
MKLRLLLLCLLLSSVAFAQHGFKIGITPLNKNFYVCTSYGLPDGTTQFPANAVFAVTNAGIVLIDTPWGEDQTKQLIDTLQKRFNQKIALCISTHFHDDRTGGLDVLNKKDVETYASKLTYKLGKSRGEQLPNFTFAADTTFTVDSLEIQTFYPGEGHTRDNIVVWFPKDKILVGGCLIKSLDTKDIGYTLDANVSQWPLSVQKVAEKYKDAKFVIPGHQGWKGGLKQLPYTLKIIATQK